MKRPVLTLLFFCLLFRILPAQVTCDPVFPNVDDNVTIYYNATQGNGALSGVSPVYAHLGVITNLSTGPTDWKHVATTWAVNNAAATMTNVSPNVWSKTFNIRTFFGIGANETVLKLAFVFRNTNGSIVGRASDGSDMFYNVYPDNAPLQTLMLEPVNLSQITSLNAQINVRVAASKPSTMTLYDNGTVVSTQNNTELLQKNLTVSTGGFHQVHAVAVAGNERDTVSFTYIVPDNLPAQDPPAGTKNGITQLTAGSVRLSLYAPGKQIVYVIGDFNDWAPAPAFQMRKSLDGNTFWIDLQNIPPGEPVRFQYLVDGALRIADPLSTLVLDPWNDPYIPPFTYPNLPAYPTGLTSGIVSVIQTEVQPFNWQIQNFNKPKKSDLVVYELLMRDFISRHDYQTLLDTLDYLDNLGVTAIELMPVNEFDGNISWGYNPAYHKALDKYYGDANALKTLIDACHQRGIAVILDVVFNQATGASPLAQLYWDAANNRPAANNPWLNPTARHDFNVFNDFNHESAATKSYVKNCLEYWVTEFKADGFRFDLSKGFTQKNTVGNTAAWGVYDASRISILKDYADFIWDIDPDFYVILEHFANNDEEKELAEYGMMLWGNMWGAYKETALGYTTATNLTGISYQQRGWSVPHLVGYMESHDEERIAYELKTYGNAIPAYNLRTLPVGMRRIEMLNNIFYTIPGPKMLWQFGEVGYDFSKFLCENGVSDPGCNVSPKPIRWDYFNDPWRRHLYDATASLLQLRKSHDVFETGSFQANLNGGAIRSVFLNHPDMNVAVFANVGTTANSVVNPSFQHTGYWYEYYTGDTLLVTSGVPSTFSMAPGEYRLYLDKKVELPPYVTLPAAEPVGATDYFAVQPNPVADQLLVRFSLNQRSEVWLEIRDMSGRRIEQRDMGTLPEGEYETPVTAGNWPAGIYLATLRDDKGGITSKRVVRSSD